VKRKHNLLKSGALALIGAYQRWVSPLTPASCRFRPTCSEYARQAISMHGLFRGGWLALKRLCRCHPFSACGYDPVPEPLDTPRRHVLEAEGGHDCSH